MTQMEVHNIKSPEISTINRGTGSKESGILMVNILLLELLEFQGVEWSKLQVRECAEMIYSECYWFTVSEFKHFILKIKRADFECLKDYSRFAPKHLMQCSKEYIPECLAVREQQEYHNKRQIQQPDQGVEYVPSEKVTEALKELVGQMQSDIKQEQEADEKELEDKAVKTAEAYAKLHGLELDWEKFFKDRETEMRSKNRK